MQKLVYGVGINDLPGSADHLPHYKRWAGMLKRCYYKPYQLKNPRYIGVTVCNEWLTFSRFKAWMDRQKWEGMELDKDLLSGEHKVYSPETCCFIPKRVNMFMTHSQGGYLGLDGVRLTRKKFEARVGFAGESIYLGRYESPEEAFRAVCAERLAIAKRLASDLPKSIGDALTAKYQKIYEKSRVMDIETFRESLIFIQSSASHAR